MEDFLQKLLKVCQEQPENLLICTPYIELVLLMFYGLLQAGLKVNFISQDDEFWELDQINIFYTSELTLQTDYYEFGTYAANCCDYIVLVGKKHTEPILKVYWKQV